MTSLPHILFVCGRNRWRSPTAEAVYRCDPRIEVRSAGVSAQSRHRVSREDIAWADLILVMEWKYKERVRSTAWEMRMPPIQCLGIPDKYDYIQPELVARIKETVEPLIQQLLTN
jgi:predicted protein tyrosine phosphatase